MIKKVRSVYNGPIVYNANHGKEDGIKWFDKIDIIGTSAYYPVGEKPNDSYETMLKNWKRE
ncbi:hypothetical protein MHB53_10905 [Bacillus sp. FSL K6-3431]|uniref:glycoside hydrolase family 113 n=1 Tax=Bacillus sp. FSL K6-3431 TaxID=2921500 RepID=UPI0030F9FC6F